MAIAYLLCLIPVIISTILWIQTRKFHIVECVIASVIPFAIVGIFHLCSHDMGTSDYFTYSGKVVDLKRTPLWHASWTELQTYTDSKGVVKTRIVHKSKTHYPDWYVNLEFPNYTTTFSISEAKYKELAVRLGNNEKKKKGYRPDYDWGDKYDYYVNNDTNVMIPVTERGSFKNKVKATPTLFSFSPVPESVLFNYPIPTTFNGNRIVNRINCTIHNEEWDKFNTRVCFKTSANVILVEFSGLQEEAVRLESKWIRAKFNDIVLCKGSDWSYVFGWTDNKILLRDLESILLTSDLSPALINQIEPLISAEYKSKNFEDFDYIEIDPPIWVYILLACVNVIIMCSVVLYFYNNDILKDDGF